MSIRFIVISGYIALCTILGAVLMLTYVSSASAAGFDCNKANIPAEVVICHNEELSYVDERMTQMYNTLYGLVGESSKRQLTEDQRAWLRLRNFCGGNDDQCIAYAYTFRIYQLCMIDRIRDIYKNECGAGL